MVGHVFLIQVRFCLDYYQLDILGICSGTFCLFPGGRCEWFLSVSLPILRKLDLSFSCWGHRITQSSAAGCLSALTEKEIEGVSGGYLRSLSECIEKKPQEVLQYIWIYKKIRPSRKTIQFGYQVFVFFLYIHECVFFSCLSHQS